MIKISISYPPITNKYGQKAMVSQNRNVQYFKKPTYLIPVIHAQAATLLKNNGFDVYWDDGNAQLKEYNQWFDDLVASAPDIIVLESTTPVMKKYWSISKDLRNKLPNSILIMTGYHSMRMPLETLDVSDFDIVLKSNHIDFSLLSVANYFKNNGFEDWRDKIDVEGLVFFDSEGIIKDTGNFKLVENINESPIIDRSLIRWKDYAYENGNFLRTPGTYASSVIRDCTFGKCTFCRYNGPDLSFSIMDIKKSVDEFEHLINIGVREIFDDSGVWFRGKDARDFANEIINRGLHKKGCYFGFNTRFEYLDEETLKLLAKANFRFILIGLESGSDYTLSLLKKGYTQKGVLNNLKLLKKYNFHTHLTIMVGYYWETKEMLDQTVNFVKKLMFNGYARTLQVTICTPVDYTPYHIDCIENKKLLTSDYDDHDMSSVIVETPIDKKYYYDAIKELYGIAFHPKFIIRQIIFLFRFKIRDWEFLFTYGIRAIRRVRQHIFNLTHKNLT